MPQPVGSAVEAQQAGLPLEQGRPPFPSRLLLSLTGEASTPEAETVYCGGLVKLATTTDGQGDSRSQQAMQLYLAPWSSAVHLDASTPAVPRPTSCCRVKGAPERRRRCGLCSDLGDLADQGAWGNLAGQEQAKPACTPAATKPRKTKPKLCVAAIKHERQRLSDGVHIGSSAFGRHWRETFS